MTDPDQPWHTRGHCRQLTDWFYRRDHELDRDWQRRANVAKRICASCPVRQECLNAAIEGREPEGVWGGEDFPIEWRKARRLQTEARAIIAARAAPLMPPLRVEAGEWS